jgi:hypothetical protein
MTAKAVSIARDIASNLRLRQTALAVTESFDTDLLPVITVGTNVAKAPGAQIKVVPQDWPLAKDILGLTALAFGPHKIQIVLEANAEAGDADEDDVNSWAVLLPIIGECVLRGCRVEIYNSATADSPDLADITAGNLKASFDPHVQFGMIANQ